MNLVVLGANGRTGEHVIRVALERGLNVTAVVRSIEKEPTIKNDRLAVKVGDPCDPKFLADVFRGQNAVISTLGGRSPAKAATSVYYRSAEAIAEAAWDSGLDRVLVISTALLFPARTLLEKILSLIVRHTVASATRMENTLIDAKLNWTVARCGFLKDDAEPGYRSEEGQLPQKGSSVSRLGLAHFLVDAIENPDACQRVFGVSSPVR